MSVSINDRKEVLFPPLPTKLFPFYCQVSDFLYKLHKTLLVESLLRTKASKSHVDNSLDSFEALLPRLADTFTY